MKDLLVCPVCKKEYDDRGKFAAHVFGGYKPENPHAIFIKNVYFKLKQLFYNETLTAEAVTKQFDFPIHSIMVLNAWRKIFGKEIANERIRRVNKSVRKGKTPWNKGKTYRKVYTNICQLPECNKEFETTNKKAQTCSKEHRYKLNKIKEAKTKGIVFTDLSERPCEYCHKMFKPPRIDVETCSEDCGYKLRSERQLENTPLNTCEICGLVFRIRDKGYSKCHTCGSKECKNTYYRNSMLEKYGVENPMQVGEFARKNYISAATAPSGLERHVMNFNIENLECCEFKVSVSFINGKTKYPDFIVKGTNKVIEVNGHYHYPWFTGQTIEEHVKYFIDSYKEAGYECLIIWDKELKRKKDREITKQKILDFIES